MFRGMQNDVTVTIYYHFQEIGRSPNTMHLMPLLAPSLCKSLIFGDVEVREWRDECICEYEYMLE
jgi:hypothetical protein